MQTETEWKVLETSKSVMQNQPPSLLHRDATSIIMIVEVSKNDHCKVDKIQRNFYFHNNVIFGCFLSITQVYVVFQY